MQTLSFLGLGTEWSVLVDGDRFSDVAKQAVLDYAQDFERRFSRFLPDSEVNAWRDRPTGCYPVSPDLATLLERAEELRWLTAGAYDPAVGGVLERAGYGLRPTDSSSSIRDYALPHWSLQGDGLTISGPVTFDLGGMGKGYCIDGVARILGEHGLQHFLVEGGGDMYGTSKADGSPWNVAIEYPGQPELAAGTVELRYQGLAVSDRFRRRFGRHHHIMHPEKREAVDTIDGCAALARSAWGADCMTSGLFLVPADRYPALAQVFAAEYVVFFPAGRARQSPGWPGPLFGT